jgi:hypothetical protein
LLRADPGRVSRAFLLVVTLSLLAGLFLPGALQYRFGVFNEEMMARRLPAAARKQLDDFEARKLQLRSQLQTIDARLGLNGPPSRTAAAGEMAALFAARQDVQRRLDTAAPPIYLDPFYLGSTMLLWPVMYSCLGTLVVILRPHGAGGVVRVRPGRVLLVATAICFLYRWPTWLRQFPLFQVGRKVYAAGNFDVSPASFFLQEGNALLICVLLAVLWLQWASSLKERQAELTLLDADPERAAFDCANLERLSLTFFHWQLCSAVLALGFLNYTRFFWQFVIGVTSSTR